jgi:hypothetical protein
MGFIGNMITATIKVAMAPVAIAMDVVTVVVKPKNAIHTKQLLDSAASDAKKAIEEIT